MARAPEAFTHWSSRLAGDHSWSPAFFRQWCDRERDRCKAKETLTEWIIGAARQHLHQDHRYPRCFASDDSDESGCWLRGGRDDPLLLSPSVKGQLRVGR